MGQCLLSTCRRRERRRALRNMTGQLLTISFVSTSPQNVINQFHALASEGKCNFIGNIDVGSTVTVQFLKERYHAVVLVSTSCNLTVVWHTACQVVTWSMHHGVRLG